MNLYNQSKKSSTLRARMIAILVLLVSFQVSRAQVLVPYAGSNTISCGTSTVIQDHMGFTTYSNNANGFVVINGGFQAQVVITCTYIIESNFDYIRIYNGA